MGYEKVEYTDKYEDAEKFKFEAPGDSIEGLRLDSSDDIDGDYGVFQIWVLQNEDTKVVSKVLLGGVLLDKAKKADGQDGDAFKLVFNGLKDNKAKTRQYKDYDVFIDRRSPKTNWDSKEAF